MLYCLRFAICENKNRLVSIHFLILPHSSVTGPFCCFEVTRIMALNTSKHPKIIANRAFCLQCELARYNVAGLLD